MISETNMQLSTFIVTTLVVVGLLFILLQLTRLYRLHSTMSDITYSIILIVLGFIIMNTIVGYVAMYLAFDLAPLINVSMTVYFSVGYISYLLLWILGINHYLKRIIRLTNDKLASYKRINLLIKIQIGIMLSLIVILLNIIPPLTSYVESVITIGMLSQYLFVLTAIIALGTFSFFYRMLKNEQEKNASKLIKARLELLKLSIIPQIFVSLGILAGTFGLIINTGYPTFVVIGPALIWVAVMTMMSSIISLWSVNIPNRIRIRFNIAPTRFKYIAKHG
jgi:hypothetical protein